MPEASGLGVESIGHEGLTNAAELVTSVGETSHGFRGLWRNEGRVLPHGEYQVRVLANVQSGQPRKTRA
jgi:hypothetical protein